MRILVTGGAGYIGSVSARVLLDAGHEVVVLDTLERGNEAAVDPRAEFVQGDVGDWTALRGALADCDCVLHLAGYIEVAESMELPGKYFKNNVGRPLGMLELMREVGPDKIVFSSTAAVYGEPDRVPITEDAPVRPINAYGASKAQFEEVLEWYAKAYGLESVVFRYFNVAGAWPDGSIGEAHDPETHIIPRILTSIAGGRDEFEIFGGDYPTEDGTCIRDYIHVRDLAAAHRLAAERLVAGEGGGLFNLGNSRGYSNMEVLRTCAEVTDTDPEIRIGRRRPGDPAVLIAANEKAGSELGWEPEHGDLGEIVRDAWAFHQSHPDGYT